MIKNLIIGLLLCVIWVGWIKWPEEKGTHFLEITSDAGMTTWSVKQGMPVLSFKNGELIANDDGTVSISPGNQGNKGNFKKGYYFKESF